MVSLDSAIYFHTIVSVRLRKGILLVAANVMGFEPDEVPHFVLANKSGMQPQSLDEIEIRGESISSVRRNFKKPRMNPWGGDSDTYSECL